MAKLHKLVKRSVLRDEVRDSLLDSIVRGELQPGERIIETRIAEMMGVSQAPVREAMRELELMGFIESEPHRGATVCHLAQDEILTVYPVRATIEGIAGRLATGRMTEEHFHQLEIELANMTDAALHDDRHTQSMANIAFHRVIMEASGNRTLLRLWELMRLHNWTFVTAVLSGQSLTELAARHQILIDALRKGDPIQTEEAMRHHIEEAAGWLAASLADPVVPQKQTRME